MYHLTPLVLKGRFKLNNILLYIETVNNKIAHFKTGEISDWVLYLGWYLVPYLKSEDQGPTYLAPLPHPPSKAHTSTNVEMDKVQGAFYFKMAAL